MKGVVILGGASPWSCCITLIEAANTSVSPSSSSWFPVAPPVVCSGLATSGVMPTESFFSLLKIERTAAKTYRRQISAKADVFDCIEGF